jgi:hypothetical protein
MKDDFWSSPDGQINNWIYVARNMATLVLAAFFCAFVIVFIINLHSNQKEITRLTKRVIIAENQLTEQKLQFDTFKKLTSDEFESTWRGIGYLNGNFKALGLGYHLEDKDFVPPDEVERILKYDDE